MREDGEQETSLVLVEIEQTGYTCSYRTYWRRWEVGMTDKQTVLTALQDEFDGWETVLASLTEAQITAPLLDDHWSVKDVIVHLWAWQQRSNARLSAALHNTSPRYPAWPEQFDPETEGQPDDLNAWLYAASRDTPWSTVYQDWRSGFLHLLDQGWALPESDILDKNMYPWLEGYALIDVLQGSYEHHQEHAAFLAPALDRIRRYGNS